jgi:hypothetical protein
MKKSLDRDRRDEEEEVGWTRIGTGGTKKNRDRRDEEGQGQGQEG